MDDPIYSLIVLLAIVCILGLLLSKLFGATPKSKGRVGELSIASVLSREISRGLHGYVLRNLYIPNNGGTVEIDVTFVCTKGIFVFESKNYAGYIFGSENQRYWTVTLYAGKDWMGFKKTEKHKFFNPIWQNKAHIRALRNIVGGFVQMHSVVVFSDRGELKSIDYDDSNVRILKTSSLKYYVAGIRRDYPDVLSAEEVDDLYRKLLTYADVDDEVKNKHVSDINKRKNDPTRCPRCGGKLVVRTARKGTNAGEQFYGCSNYPRCKYTRNI